MNTTCHRKKPVTWTLAAAAAPAVLLFGAATAHADATYWIKSPSGNIGCVLSVTNGLGSAVCDAADHTWAAPPLPADCPHPHDPVFYLHQRVDNTGRPDIDQCHAGNTPVYASNLQTLDYGQTQSAGAITCDSEPLGITCTDTGTGHFFRISRDSYQLG
jgi:hypothetical protein